MTDSKDPFADHPYVPPTEREEASTRAPDSSETAAPETTSPEDAGREHTTSAPETGQPAPAPTTAASEQPPARDAYTHRYATQGSSSTEPEAGRVDPTRSFPADDTTAFSTDDGGNQPTAKPKKRRGRRLAGATALILLAGGAGYGGAYLQDQAQDDSGNSSNVSSLDTGKVTNTNVPAGAVEQVAAKVLPSVVQINVKGSQESGSGTGIIISSDGEILTNNHVTAVAGKSGTITVAFNDGSNTTAKIVGADPKTDLAVIKAKGKTGLTPATLGTSADLRVGQEVVAIGSPFGLESTVTQGIVSALNRPVTSSDGSSDPTKSNTFPAIQTDAAINPGNSGGPLVDIKGNVIGINSAIKASGSTEGGSIGLGFAIPVDLAKNVSKHLVKGEKVEHAQIGVSVRPAVGADGITGVGALIGDVTSGGAGDKAGLKKGDIITAVNGHLIPSSEALVASVRGYQPGEKVTVSFRRDGKQTQIDVTLDSDGGSTTG
ncbi:trypsin-like peptidase domain-containing protein [Aeromicrobium sp.]|uniref:S1C family serine protease n=1 Tax=Aeromicrobium sp. TaxID=1871063 RepID=UPI003C6250A1